MVSIEWALKSWHLGGGHSSEIGPYLLSAPGVSSTMFNCWKLIFPKQWFWGKLPGVNVFFCLFGKSIKSNVVLVIYASISNSWVTKTETCNLSNTSSSLWPLVFLTQNGKAKEIGGGIKDICEKEAVVHTIYPNTWRARGRWISESEVSLVYTPNSRPAKAAWWEPAIIK